MSIRSSDRPSRIQTASQGVRRVSKDAFNTFVVWKLKTLFYDVVISWGEQTSKWRKSKDFLFTHRNLVYLASSGPGPGQVKVR